MNRSVRLLSFFASVTSLCGAIVGTAAAKENLYYQLTPEGQINAHTPSDWIAGLKDPNAVDRRAAAVALGKMPTDEAKRAIPALVALLSDPSEMVRQAAAETLGGFGSEARPAIPGLIQQLNDSVEPVRNAAAAALYFIAMNRDRQMDPEPEKALQQALQGHQSASIRTQLKMVDTLGTFACVDSPRSHG